MVMSRKRRMRRRFAKPIDQQTMAQAFAGPGMDTRQWISYGIVTAGGEPDIVTFDEEEGVVFVSVVLEPTKVPINARIGNAVAGNGEGEYFPFVQGDEVLVAIPEGDERAGAVIICRLNNQIDKFPMESVAGQDPTTNTFAFQRRRTPYIQETAGPIYFRSATTGAFLSIDTAGSVTIKDGENSALQMSPDLIGFQGPSEEGTSPDFVLQADLTGKRVTIQMGDSQFMLNASDADSLPGEVWLAVPNTMNIALATNNPVEHVLTLEAFLAILEISLTAIGGGFGVPAVLAMQALVATGVTTLTTLTQTALTTGLPLAAAIPKPPPAPNGLQTAPGLGAVKFLTG